jgi:hypothetical protein
MSTAKLIRWSGLANILAGVLYFLAVLIHPAGEDAAAMLLPTWVPAHVLGGVSAVFLLFGLIGLYARQAEKTGWLGFIGFLLTFTGTIFLAVEEFPAATINPSIPPAALVVFLMLSVPFTLGFLLFGVVTMRAGVLPRWSGLLLILGVVLLVAGSASHVIGIIAAAVFGLGLAWLGYALWSEKGEIA